MTRRLHRTPRRSNRRCELCDYPDPQGTRYLKTFGESWWVCTRCHTSITKDTLKRNPARETHKTP